MKKILLAFGLFGLFALFGCLGSWGVNSQTQNICVKSKFIDSGSGRDDTSHYIIVSTKGDTFEVDRAYTNILNKQSNPDVIYGSMELNHSYTINTTGYSIDVNYNYPLIQSIEDTGPCK